MSDCQLVERKHLTTNKSAIKVDLSLKCHD